ncbi:MAG: nucleotidyltransferase family protein [Clostridia bacterium]|nr:nucleotidyltransferase family protein [Clostridia bacterium]
MSVMSLLKEKRHDIMNIASSNGVTKISLFGSVARGEETVNSDIDFLVEFEENRSLFDLIRLKQELESLLQRPIDVVTENGVHPMMRDGILSQVVEL